MLVLFTLALLKSASSTYIAQATSINESSVRSALGKFLDENIVKRKLRDDRHNSYIYSLDERISNREIIDFVVDRGYEEEFSYILSTEGFIFSIEDKALIQLTEEIYREKEIQTTPLSVNDSDSILKNVKDKINNLKPKHYQVLEYICNYPGSTTHEIANKLGFNESTLHNYLKTIKDLNLTWRKSIPLNPGQQYEYFPIPEAKTLIVGNDNETADDAQNFNYQESFNNSKEQTFERKKSTSSESIQQFSNKLKRLCDLNREFNSLKQELIKEGGESVEDLIDQYLLQ
ncbi:MAG: hypothetical protein Tsb0014_09880 [Pleurocapsa sp.]